jgi:hypothetical protein
MSEYKKGYNLAKKEAKEYSTISEIKSSYSKASEEFIKGFIDGFDEYWTEKLMKEF